MNIIRKGIRVYTLGPLIHNDDVVKSLEEECIFRIDNIEDIAKLKPGDTIVIRSHGTTPDIIEQLKQTGAKLMDATCPYVSSIQRKARKYYGEGYQIVIVGDPNHPEVVGINGWCNNTALVTRDGSELKELPQKVCVLSQTTENNPTMKNFGGSLPAGEDVLAFNTICSATGERQGSADEVSKRVDLMIVIGGKQSSNTRKLYEICSANCKIHYWWKM